ncbi:MAG: glycoside hydrolase family 3 C-terminal domain-containing protein [Eubacterium sp.]|nr:glycoside hydrolase family 3 C-terminal domain-containing protein [Eubacterium sp.]
MQRKINEDLEKKIDGIIASMTVSEKCDSMTANRNAIERLGIPDFTVGGEAAHGIQARHDQVSDVGLTEYTTIFPNPNGLAAGFDEDLLFEIGSLVGDEGRSLFNEKRNRTLCAWAPTIDMERDPRWGRNEEGYGEDPVLASTLAAAYIRGLKGDVPDFVKFGATLKHFYANNVEDGRFTSDSVINDRLKYEYYLEVFRLCIKKSDPEAVMTAYNLINGTPCILNPDILDILKTWGLTHVVCDANAMVQLVSDQKVFDDDMYSVAASIKKGIDIFADDNEKTSEALKRALQNNLLSEHEIDACLKNRFCTFARLGLFSEEEIYPHDIYNMSKVNTASGRALSRKAAAKTAVLLKNDGLLPMDKNTPVAVLGPFAERCPLDWYSGITDHAVTLYEGIKDAYSEMYKKDILKDDLIPEVRIKKDGRYLGLKKEDTLIDKNSHVLFMSSDPDMNRDCYSLMEVEPEDAETFKIMLWDDRRVTIRSMSTGKLLTVKKPGEITLTEYCDKDEIFVFPDDAFGWFAEEEFRFADKSGNIITFDEPNAASFWMDDRIDSFINVFDKNVLSGISFETVESFEDKIDRIKEEGMTCVAAFGLHPIVNCREERDRNSIELPPFQRIVYKYIRESFDRNLLILTANAPLGIVPEAEDSLTDAILWTVLGSEELGHGISDIIFGDVSPSGRLPMTWYRHDSDLPDKSDYDIIGNPRTYMYYKGDTLYDFGYGLSYTDFKYDNLSVQDVGKYIEITVDITNIGDVPSDHSVLVYFRKEKDGLLRPVKRLAVFTMETDIKPGETRQVALMAEKDDMMFYDGTGMSFESGEYTFLCSDKELKISIGN